MKAFTDTTGKPVLFLYQNTLLFPESGNVAGVILGQCIFDASGEPRGKYLNDSLYDENGHIIAKRDEETAQSKLSLTGIMQSAGAILQKIRNHHCSRIIPTSIWVSVTAIEFFGSRRKMVAM